MKQLTQQEYDSLVALARLGYKCLHGFATDDGAEFGLLEEVTLPNRYKYWRTTDLAKLPEGL